MKDNYIKICSICGEEYYGYGNNAEPVKNGQCCGECNSEVVLPFRFNYTKLQKDMAKLNSKVRKISLRDHKSVQLEYIEDCKVLTDYKNHFIRNVSLENLDKAISILNKIYNRCSFICNSYDYICELEQCYNNFSN